MRVRRASLVVGVAVLIAIVTATVAIHEAHGSKQATAPPLPALHHQTGSTPNTLPCSWGLSGDTGCPGASIVSVTTSTPRKAGEPHPVTDVLTSAKLTTVTLGAATSLKVTIHNDSSQQTPVSVWLSGPPRLAQFRLLGSDQSYTVTFGHLGMILFGGRTNLTITVGYQAEVYPVDFVLPG